MIMKSLRSVTVDLTESSVVVKVSSGTDRFEFYVFPVDIIDPAIALQFAGALASSPRLPKSVSDDESYS